MHEMDQSEKYSIENRRYGEVIISKTINTTEIWK